MKIEDSMREALAQLVPQENIRMKEPMKNHTTFRIGGEADCVVWVENEQQIAALLSFCHQNQIPNMIVGNGSNLLFADEGYRGLIILVGQKMDRIQVEQDTLRVGAGALMAKVAGVALQNSLTGLEFAGGIPGTIGGGIVMNAGAYGSELKDVVTSVTVLDEKGNRLVLPAEDMEFGYRTSIIKHKAYVVTEVTMKLTHGDPQIIKNTMDDLNRKRREKQPLEYPSAGSTFKRPEGHFAGALIENAGLKGYRIGDAMVSDKHCGFVVNVGNATEKEVHALMEHVQKTVKEQFDVVLEPEVISVR